VPSQLQPQEQSGEDASEYGRTLRFRGWQFRFQRSHLLQQLIRALRFERVYTANGEANVDHYIVTQTGLGHKAQRYLADDSAELHAGRAQRPKFLNFEDFPRYGKAHGSSPHNQYNTTRYLIL